MCESNIHSVLVYHKTDIRRIKNLAFCVSEVRMSQDLHRRLVSVARDN